MKTGFTLVLILLFTANCYSQNTDSIPYNPKRIDINEKNWSVSFNTGVQHRYFLGTGISKNYFLGSPHGIYGYDIYSSVAVFPAFKSQQKTIFTVSMGAIASGNGIVAGIEIKYLKEKNLDDIMIIPKIGLGFGMLHITYGYALSTNKYPLADIGKNVFAMHINLPFYTKNLLKDKPESKYP
jgi:hypothetical protein